MTKLALACSLALTLMACASNPNNSAPAAAPAANGTTSAPASGTAPAAASAQAPAKPKLVCEEQKPLGSLLPQRICMTPEEAAARRKAAQDRVQNMQNQSAVGPGQSSSSGG